MDPDSKATIKSFFNLREFFRNAMSSKDFFGSGVDTYDLRKISNILSESKIFSIPPSVFNEVWKAIDEYLLEDSGVNLPDECFGRDVTTPTLTNTWDVSHIDELFTEENLWKGVLDPMVDYISDPKNLWKYPTKFPFTHMFFGYGSGIELSEFQVNMRFGSGDTVATVQDPLTGQAVRIGYDEFESYRMLGHLITADGLVFEMNSYSYVTPARLPDGRYINGSITVDGDFSEQAKSLENPQTPEDRALHRQLVSNSVEYLIKESTALGYGTHSQYVRNMLANDKDLFTLIYCDGLDPTTNKALPPGTFMLGVRATGLSYYISRLSRGAAYVVDKNFSKQFTYVCEREDGVASDIDGSWGSPWSLAPWFIPTLVTLINENNKTFIFDGNYDKGSRKEFTKKYKRQLKVKKRRAVLPAYRVIDIAPKVVRRKTSSIIRNSCSGTGRKLTHRHDRDGHERVNILRGVLPLSAEDRTALQLRNYVVYTEGQPSDSDRDRLVRRRHPLRQPGEWLAVRTTWVRETVVGDESLPYSPAVRRLSKSNIMNLIKSNRL